MVLKETFSVTYPFGKSGPVTEENFRCRGVPTEKIVAVLAGEFPEGMDRQGFICFCIDSALGQEATEVSAHGPIRVEVLRVDYVTDDSALLMKLLQEGVHSEVEWRFRSFGALGPVPLRHPLQAILLCMVCPATSPGRQMGECDKAIAEYTEAIRLNLNDAEAHHKRGNSYAIKGDDDKAIADYTEAVRLDPNHALAYYNRANSYDRKGDDDKAIADFTQAIRLARNFAEAYHNRGLSHDKKGDHDKALADFTEAIRLDPDAAAIAYHSRGVSHAGRGDDDKAIADFTHAIRLAPTQAIFYLSRAKAHRALADNVQADSDEKKAQELGRQK